MARNPEELIVFDTPEDAYDRADEDFSVANIINPAAPWIGLAAQVAALEWVMVLMTEPAATCESTATAVRQRLAAMHQRLGS